MAAGHAGQIRHRPRNILDTDDGLRAVFYYSIYRLVRAIAAKRKAQINVWSMVFLLSTILPYLYVLFFGRNMPWWVYAVVVALMAQGAYTLVVRRQGKSGPGSKGTP